MLRRGHGLRRLNLSSPPRAGDAAGSRGAGAPRDAIQDRASFDDPAAPGRGVRHLVVAGTAVVDDGQFVETAAPGRAFLAEPRAPAAPCFGWNAENDSAPGTPRSG